MDEKKKILQPYVVYRLMINDILYIEILYNEEEVFIVNYGSIDKKIVKLTTALDVAIVSIGDIPRATIDLKTGEIRTTMVHIPTLFVRDYGELYLKKQDIQTQKALLQNAKSFIENAKKLGKEKNELELHTHFMEVLTGEEFFDFIKDKVPFIDFDIDGNLVRTYTYDKDSPNNINRGYEQHYISEIKANRYLRQRVIDNLSITPSVKTDFTELAKISSRRQALLELASYAKVAKKTRLFEERKASNWKQDIASERSEARRDIYFDMLIVSLKSLHNQGVKYVEFSYSTAGTIQSIYGNLASNPKLRVEGIDFNFLYSCHRTKKLDAYRIRASTDKKVQRKSVEAVLPRLIEGGLVKGFDLMGLEGEITERDLEPSVNDPNGSLYDKIYTVMDILTRYRDRYLVMRLHAGETRFGKDLDLDAIIDEKKQNPERTMIIIDKVVRDLSERRKEKIELPPPYIRIGHGLHFNKTDNYLRLLQKYKVIVEINASSNFTLDNITDLSLLPYNWYLDNGVPIVISTDGGGFYLTTPLDEMMIAKIFGAKAEKIIKTREMYSDVLKGGK